MADADYTFAQARARLDDIVSQVRKKDTSLEKSLDLLEEGVRLANACTEQIDQSEWRAAAADPSAEAMDAAAPDERPAVSELEVANAGADDSATPSNEDGAPDPEAVSEDAE